MAQILQMTENKKSYDLKIKAEELEADIAFFDARVSLIGEKLATTYSQAQRQLYLRLNDCFQIELNAINKNRKQMHERRKRKR